MTAKHGWLITRDFISSDQDSSVGVSGPRDTPFEREEIRRHPDRKQFRMYDDDGELYLEGWYVGPDDERLLSPLDGYGMPSYGTTIIAYRTNGKTGPFEVV